MKRVLLGIILGILLIGVGFVLAEETIICSINSDCGEASTSFTFCKNTTHVCTTTTTPTCKNASTNASSCKNIKENTCWICENGCENRACVIKNENKAETKDKNKTENDNKKPNKLRESLQAYLNSAECPEQCTCAGSTIKCETETGRIMTVVAGHSGNVIIITQTANASTNVILIKNASGTWGNFSGKIKKIKYLPDEIRERVLKKLKLETCTNCSMTLNEDGNYVMNLSGIYKVLWIFPRKAIVVTKVNSETGEVSVIKKPFWKFRAE